MARGQATPHFDTTQPTAAPILAPAGVSPIRAAGPRFRTTPMVAAFSGEPGHRFDTSTASSLHGGRAKAIFVMDADGNIYASLIHRAGSFHHSSFLAGAPVAGAGEIVVDNGRLVMINNASGHYLPDPDTTSQVFSVMRARGVNVDVIEKQDLRRRSEGR